MTDVGELQRIYNANKEKRATEYCKCILQRLKEEARFGNNETPVIGDMTPLLKHKLEGSGLTLLHKKKCNGSCGGGLDPCECPERWFASFPTR